MLNIEETHSYEVDPGAELEKERVTALAAMQAARERGEWRGYLNWAMGLGKTRLAARDIQQFWQQNPDARVLWLCDSNNPLNHAREELTAELGEYVTHGNLFGRESEDQAQVVYANFQTMQGDLGGGKTYQAFDPAEFDYVVVDEGHHAPAPTYREVIEYFKPKFRLGLTGTPERRDQQGLKEIFGEELHTVLLEHAIAKNYLAKPDYRVLTDHVKRLDQIETDIGTFSLNQLNREIFVRRRDGEISDMVAEHLYEIENPRVLVFCETIAHAERMAELLPGNVATDHSKLHPDVQDSRFKAFRAGEIDTLVTIGKYLEGVNVPEVNVVVFLRDTTSRPYWLQMVGRGLRKYPGKDGVLILDFVASWERIKDIKYLEEGVRQAYSNQSARSPVEVKAPFRFNFSEEALQAIEVVEYAREQRLEKPVTLPTKQSQADAEIECLLGIAPPERGP